MAIKGKNNKQPAAAEMNFLATLFNQGAFDNAEKLALKITQNYPDHGFGWKVLGAIYQSRGLLDKAFDALKRAADQMPHDCEAQYNLANYFYDRNQLDDAIYAYKKAIRINPDFFQAHYNLGNAYKNNDDLVNAESSYKNALLIDNNISVLCNLAHVLYEQNKEKEAKENYEQALKINPEFSTAHVGLGVVLKAMGLIEVAEEHFREAINLDQDVEAYRHLGDLLHDRKRFKDAEDCLKTATLVHPGLVDVHLRAALFLRAQGRVKESIAYFNQALQIEPTRKDVHLELGLAKNDLGQFLEAELSFKDALRLDPDYYQTYNNLGLVLYKMSKHSEAVASFSKAIELNSRDASLYSNLSLPLAAMGELKKAENALVKSIEIQPGYCNAYINFCTNYLAQGSYEKAEAMCIEGLKYHPNSTVLKSNLLFAMNYSDNHSAEYRLLQAQKFDHIVTEQLEHAFTEWQSVYHKKRLRVAFISGDLRQHPVAYFLENLIRNIDLSKFELYAYVTDDREDLTTGRLKPNFSFWKSLMGVSDQAAAKLIHDDCIDVLFDLSGHTAGSRLPVFAYKPAPIQVSWLGYFATTGMKSVDYFIADEVGVPASHQVHFVEKVKYLPDTRLCFIAPSNQVEVSSLPALSNGYITFASFQNLAKAGSEVLKLWAEIMLAVPNSKLRWQSAGLKDDVLKNEILARFNKLGISAERLILIGAVPRLDYLKSHNEVDVILDTFPFPGGTTTCEALWMGVPTLTLAGDRLISRQGASILTAAGLDDFVVNSKSDYLKKAIALSSDINRLAQLRNNLRIQVLASPLFDAKRFARNMEVAILEMWHDYCQNVAQDINKAGRTVLQEPETEQQALEEYQHHEVIIVSATRFSEEDFWSKSALGLSLPRHLKQSHNLTVNITFDNTHGLSEVFNQAIEQAGDDVILVFVHDDVWLDEASLVDTLVAGLARFDVIGVAGNKRRLPDQPAWAFVDTAMNWDEPEYLSGTVSHGPHAFGEDSFYGDAPAACELLDGVLIATSKSALNVAHVRFDPQFDFHFYDMDFCRSAREAGLSIGTWPIKITHQSKGAFGTPHWAQKCQLYFNKWESNSPQQQALHSAMNEVMQMAHQHETEGQLEQAAMLYQEVLKIQPEHAEANHNLGVIEAHTKGASIALPMLERAVQSQPENEQYWVSYIDALMQSGFVESALDALELGQQYGLKPETVQILASEFIKQVETK